MHQQRHPSSTAYNLTVGVRIAGFADPAKIRAALQAVVDRHEPLRSVYRDADGSGRRCTFASMALAMHMIVLDEASADSDWTAHPRVQAAIEEIAKRPFRLESETLRVTLITDGGERHLLLVGVHHLTADGWSARQFVVEGVANFQQLVRGESPTVGPPSLSYGAWVAAERTRLESQEAAVAAAHWGEALAGAAIESRIPRGVVAPERSLKGARIAVSIPGLIRDRLRRLGREQDASMFTVILAGSQAVLARLASQEDVAVAVPFANRTEATGETIGLFVNTLPIAVRVNTATTFRELVDQAGASLRGARQHGWLPVDRIVKAAGLFAAAPDDSLCRLMINYLGHALPPIELGGMEFEYLGTFDTGESQYELSIHLEDMPQEMRGFVEYRTDCHAEKDIERFWERLLAHLEAATASPDRPLSELPILGPEDRAGLQRLEHGCHRDFALETSLDSHVERRVREAPEAIALSDSTGQLTYEEMWQLASAFAVTLRGHGVRRGDVVLICAERSRRLPVALLAIMRAGAAYCPLDPEQPLARLRHVINQARPTAIVVDPGQEQLIDDLLGGDGSIVRIAMDLEELLTGPVDDECREFDSEDPAYVIFTSGSTGRPKGVVVPHRGVVNRLRWMQEQFKLSPEDTVLQKTPYTFDVSVWEFFWPLMAGARLHLADPGAHRDPERLAEAIRAESVTTVHFVPTMLAAFVAEPDAVTCPSLRLVICSGEALPAATMEQAMRTFDSATVWNLYGPTEASIDVTCWRCRQLDAGSSVPIGAPIDNVSCFVLDKQMQRVPVGTPGELYLGGVQVALGYIGRPELTAQRFLESELADGPLYKTGDRVRWRPDGLLDYLGRIDRQVKIRGVRIELGEIEEVLRGMEGVADAAVVLRDDIGQREALVAYVVPIASECDEIELRVRLATLLPEYMVPLRVVALERLPLTSSGKVDRNALPRPSAREAPERRKLSSEERLLAGIWSSVLDVDGPSIGPGDSYFALGGDSMTSVKLRAEVRQAGFELSLKDILSHPALADMAKAMRPSDASAGEIAPPDQARPDVLPTGVEDAYPLSAMQAGMIFHSEFGETSSSYQVTFDLELEMPWRPDAFQATVNELVERHEILRTSFDLHSDGEPTQLVHERAKLQVRTLDLHGRPERERQLECDRIFDAEQVRGFDLSTAPALRLTLVRTGEATVHLFMAFHDSIFDGWSGAVFMTELCARFLANLDGGALPIERPLTRYREYVALERAAAADEAGVRHWLDVCGGAPFARLPRRERVGGTGRSRDVELEVPEETVAQLRTVANGRGAPLKAVLVTAYLAAVGRLTGERDVLVGLVSGGRPETPDSDQVLGQFLNTVPIRARLEGSWSSLVLAAHRSELEGIPFRRVPLFELVRKRGGEMPFETAFNLVHFHVYNELASQSRVALLSGRFTDPFHFPLTVNARLHPLDGSLAIVVNYNESEVDAVRARGLGDDVVSALTEIAETPDASCVEWLGDPPPLQRENTPIAPRALVAREINENGPVDPALSRAISELWCAVLEVDSAEFDHDFFAMGGDSILTVQLAARARALGYGLRPRDVFECGTLGALIKRVEGGGKGPAPASGRLGQAPVADPGLLTLAMQHQGGYECSAICFELLVALDREGVHAATDAVLGRHQLLRAVAEQDGTGGWTRRVLEQDPDRPALVWSEGGDLSGWLRRLMESVDVGRGPSALIGHLSGGGDTAFVAFVADHAAADLASLQLAAGDFLDAYAQHAAGGAISLDPAPGLADLEQVRLRDYDAGDDLRSTPLPWRPSVASLHGEERIEEIEVGADTTGDLLRLSVTAGVKVDHLLAIAAARALAAGEEGPGIELPVVVDLMDIGRSAVGVEAELVAPLAHPVPVSIADPDSSAFGLARDLAEPSQPGSRLQGLVEAAAGNGYGVEAPGVVVNHLGRIDPEVPWPLKRVVGRDVPLRGAPRRASYAIELRSQLGGAALTLEVVSPSSASSSEQLLGFGRSLRHALSEIAREAAEVPPTAAKAAPVGGPP